MPLKLGDYADSSDESSDDGDVTTAAPGPSVLPPRRSIMASLPTPTSGAESKKRNITAEMAAGLAAIEASKAKGETVKITIPGLMDDVDGDDNEEGYVSLAQKAARRKKRGTASLLSSLPQPLQGKGVSQTRKSVVATGESQPSTSTSEQPAKKPAMMMPYSMTGKKDRDAILAKKKRIDTGGPPADDDDQADADDFMASLSGPSTAAVARRTMLVNTFEGVVDTNALLKEDKQPDQTVVDRTGGDQGPAAYPEVENAYPEVGVGYPEVESAYPEVGSGYPEVESTYPEASAQSMQVTSGGIADELLTAHERRKRQRGIGEDKIIDINGATLAGAVTSHAQRQFNEEQSMYAPQSSQFKAQGQEKKKNQLSYLLQKSQSDKMRLAQKWSSGRANQAAAQNRYGW